MSVYSGYGFIITQMERKQIETSSYNPYYISIFDHKPISKAVMIAINVLPNISSPVKPKQRDKKDQTKSKPYHITIGRGKDTTNRTRPG